MKQISTIFAILLLSLPFAQDRAVTITGNCLLEGETEHSGTEIHFAAVSGSAETNTFTHFQTMLKFTNIHQNQRWII